MENHDTRENSSHKPSHGKPSQKFSHGKSKNEYEENTLPSKKVPSLQLSLPDVRFSDLKTHLSSHTNPLTPNSPPNTPNHHTGNPPNYPAGHPPPPDSFPPHLQQPPSSEQLANILLTSVHSVARTFPIRKHTTASNYLLPVHAHVASLHCLDTMLLEVTKVKFREETRGNYRCFKYLAKSVTVHLRFEQSSASHFPLRFMHLLLLPSQALPSSLEGLIFINPITWNPLRVQTIDFMAPASPFGIHNMVDPERASQTDSQGNVLPQIPTNLRFLRGPGFFPHSFGYSPHPPPFSILKHCPNLECCLLDNDWFEHNHYVHHANLRCMNLRLEQLPFVDPFYLPRLECVVLEWTNLDDEHLIVSHVADLFQKYLLTNTPSKKMRVLFRCMFLSFDDKNPFYDLALSLLEVPVMNPNVSCKNIVFWGDTFYWSLEEFETWHLTNHNNNIQFKQESLEFLNVAMHTRDWFDVTHPALAPYWCQQHVDSLLFAKDLYAMN